MINPIVVVFCPIEVDATLDDVSRVFPRLYGWLYKILRLVDIRAELA